MRFLKASILIVSLMLVACEGAVSPTEPELIQREEAQALPQQASYEIPFEDGQHDEDGPE